MSTKRLAIAVTLGLLGLGLALLGLLAAQPALAHPDEWTVCPDGPPDCDFAIIQDAVDAAAEGDLIKVATGVYTDVHARPSPPGYWGPSVITQAVYISKTVAIRGGYTAPDFSDPPDPEADPTTLDAQGQGRVLLLTGSISPTVEGLRITGGDATGLGGLPEWYDYADTGGGIFIVGATGVLSNSRVFSNTVSGLSLLNSDARLINNRVSNNIGDGLYLRSGDATLTNNRITNNTGSGLYLRSGDATLTNNRVTNNTSTGLFLCYSADTLISNTVSANTGGLLLDNSPATVISNTVSANTGDGGLVLTESDATLSGNTIISNTNSRRGGGIYLFTSQATLVRNLISANTAADDGGGVYIAVGIRMGDCLNPWANTATADASIAYQTSKLGLPRRTGNGPTLVGNIISGNTATGDGGGLYMGFAGSPTLANNMVADNQAGGAGSGLYIRASFPQLLHTTIARNRGGDGIGVYVTEHCSHSRCHCSTVGLTNTVLVSHTVGITATAGWECASTAALEATLWGTDTWANETDWGGAGVIVTGTINIWEDPAFVNPNAGDYHIGPDSGAIDTGVDAGVTTDIDGEPRPYGPGYDIGADELGPALAVAKAATPDPVATGGHLTYTLRLTNTGVVSLTATITDILPSHVTPTGVLTWTPPMILPGATWTETVAVTIEVGYVGPVTNVVQAASEEGAAGTYTNTIRVEEPISDLEAINDSPTPLGDPTTLTATVTAGSNVTYTWAFGDNDTGSGAVVSHTYPHVGTYTAVVTANNSVNELTATTTVTVDEGIAGLEASNDSPTSLGNPTTLTATISAGSNVTYTWAFGDNDTSRGAVLSHTYPDVGLYTTVVTASNSVGELTTTTTVTITQPPFHVYLPLVLKSH